MKTLLVCMILFPSIPQAGETATALHSSYVQTIPEKVEVPVNDLPEAIKTTLISDAYKGWEISKAYIITDGNDTRYYTIDLIKGEETMSVNLDSEGREIA